jgi:hypothetical protein
MHGRNLLRRAKSFSSKTEDDLASAGSGLLLEPGLGASFSSPDEMDRMTSKTIGLGLSHVSQKLKNMKNERFKKTKNISFTL